MHLGEDQRIQCMQHTLENETVNVIPPMDQVDPDLMAEIRKDWSTCKADIEFYASKLTNYEGSERRNVYRRTQHYKLREEFITKYAMFTEKELEEIIGK